MKLSREDAVVILKLIVVVEGLKEEPVSLDSYELEAIREQIEEFLGGYPENVPSNDPVGIDDDDDERYDSDELEEKAATQPIDSSVVLDHEVWTDLPMLECANLDGFPAKIEFDYGGADTISLLLNGEYVDGTVISAEYCVGAEDEQDVVHIYVDDEEAEDEFVIYSFIVDECDEPAACSWQEFLYRETYATNEAYTKFNK